MTPPEIRAAFVRLGWTDIEASEATGISRRAWARWWSGTNPLPDALATWLRAKAAGIDLPPPPPPVAVLTRR